QVDRAGGAQGAPRRAVRRLPGAAGAHRRRAVLPAAAGPGDRRGRPRLRAGGQGQPARPAPGGPRRVPGRGGAGGCGAGEKPGAVVTGRLWCDTAAADYAREALNFPGLRAVLRVDCETRPPGGAATTETRYFATSLDPAAVGPGRLLELVRGHWQGGGSLHYEKGRWGDEGPPDLRRPRR